MIAQNSYQWELMGRKSKPKLRRHLPDSLDVPDLVHPGDWIRSNYNTEGMVVRVIKCDFFGNTHYTIQFIGKRDIQDNTRRINITMLSFYNEVVTVDGKLCNLFQANKDTYEIIPIPDGIEISEKVRTFIRIRNKLRQLELFK